jgi:hypothetical protein
MKHILLALENPSTSLFIDFSKVTNGGNDFNYLIVYLIQLILGFVGLVALMYLIWGGYLYITSGINAGLAEQGKKTIKNAIVGLIIVTLSYIIVIVVVNSLWKYKA